MDKVAVIKPPIVGEAMGFITSEPVPEENIMAIRAIMVVAVVMIAGRTLKSPPSIIVL